MGLEEAAKVTQGDPEAWNIQVKIKLCYESFYLIYELG